MASMKVTITPELVERAVEKDSRHCMIAEAIKEQNPHYKSILVDLQTVRWTNPRTGKRYVCLTPEVAAAALVAFDRGDHIDPFAFTLKVAQVTQTSGATKPASPSRTLKVSGSQMTIDGGKTLPAGHLRGTAPAAHRKKTERAAERARELDPSASNVVRSAARYRQYGLRLLKES